MSPYTDTEELSLTQSVMIKCGPLRFKSTRDVRNVEAASEKKLFYSQIFKSITTARLHVLVGLHWRVQLDR